MRDMSLRFSVLDEPFCNRLVHVNLGRRLRYAALVADGWLMGGFGELSSFNLRSISESFIVYTIGLIALCSFALAPYVVKTMLVFRLSLTLLL